MKKLFFTAMVAVVAIGGAVASVNSARATTIYGPQNNSQACPSNTQIACSPNLIGRPVCNITGSGINQYTTNPDTGKCTLPLYQD